jgi:hypothetical protein
MEKDMTEAEAIEEMEKVIRKFNEDDPEVGHSQADDILCRFLMDLGYTDLVACYDKVEKWYS